MPDAASSLHCAAPAPVRILSAALGMLLCILVGCQGSSTTDIPVKDWPPGSPRQPQRLQISNPDSPDPGQWWADNILTLVPQEIYPDTGTAHLAGDFIARTNEKRVLAGLAPLETRQSLNRVAQAHAMDQAIRDYWNHRTPEDLGSRDRIAAAGAGIVSSGGENSSVARPGETTIRAVVENFSIHEGHRDLLYSTEVKYIGVGIYNFGPQEHVHYVQLLVNY